MTYLHLFWGPTVSDQNLQIFFFISGHRAVVPCSFAEICYVILVHNERASIFTFFRNTLFKYLTQNHHGRIQRELWHISGFQQASCDKMTALQICFVTEGSFHPPFLAVGPFCSTPHALSLITERLCFFSGLLIRLMH